MMTPQWWQRRVRVRIARAISPGLRAGPHRLPRAPESASSECLPDAEEEVEVSGLADVRENRLAVRVSSVRDDDRIDRRVEVVTEVKAQGADRRVITHAKTDGVGEVVEVAEAGGIRA